MHHDLMFWLRQGGITLYVLGVCSVIVVGVIIERAFAFARLRRIIRNIAVGGQSADIAEPHSERQPNLRILATLAGVNPAPNPVTNEALDDMHALAVTQVTAQLDSNLPILATIGATAPFIGLFGTVIGIIRSFHAISVYRSAGIAVVGAGIAEALVCTAAGLGVAIAAVAAYNFFRTHIRRIISQIDAFRYRAGMELNAAKQVHHHDSGGKT